MTSDEAGGPGLPTPPGLPAAPAGPVVARPWAAGATRVLTVPAATARTVLLQAARALSFSITTEQYSLVIAERGSRLRGLSMTRTRVPVLLRADLTPDGEGCLLQLRLEERWVGAAPRSVAAVYADVFTEVLTAVDDRLRQADPAAAAAFDPWWRRLPEDAVASAGATGGSAGVAARVERGLARRTSRLLDGPRKGPVAATAGAGVRTVTFVSDGSAAQFDAEVVDGMLTVGLLVAGAPGNMPRPLVEQVQAMVVLLEARLGAGQQVPDLVVAVEKAEQPVVTFLYQQAALRERLPVRQLATCTTCRLEKIVNPDFVKLRERNRRAKVLGSSVGAAFGTHHVSPFILLGRFAALKNSDPDFVCQRCQGTDADEKPVTYCPRCGDRRDESVLRVCPHCHLDLRTLLTEPTVWREVESVPVADVPSSPPPPPLPPPPLPAPGPPLPSAPGFYPDPWGRYEVRWFDGGQWTVHVGSHGAVMIDPGSPQGDQHAEHEAGRE